MRLLSRLAVFTLATISCGRNANSPSRSTAPAKATNSTRLDSLHVDWPPLPTSGFISGRAATDEDIRAKNAAFVLSSNGVAVGTPLPIAIPQYALYTDRNTHEVIPVVVVQAEEGLGLKILGVLPLTGGVPRPVPLPDTLLLGTDRPRTPPPGNGGA